MAAYVHELIKISWAISTFYLKLYEIQLDFFVFFVFGLIYLKKMFNCHVVQPCRQKIQYHEK